MSHEEVLKMMEETGLPFAYDHFVEGESPKPPFLVFLYLKADNFSADGIEYYIIANNMGYVGDLELALIPESFRTDVLKEEADTNEVLVENANVETGAFAPLLEFDGDIRKNRHVLYNCSASCPKIEDKTNEESREVQTETLTVKARPMADGYVKAKTGNKTAQTTYDGWYQKVYLPTPKEEVPAEEGQG